MRGLIPVWLTLVGLLACTPDETTKTDGTDPETTPETTPPLTFAEEEEIGDNDLDGDVCSSDVGFYFPATTTHFPVAMARFKAPDPPYEIRELGVNMYVNEPGLWGGNTCSSAVPLRLFVYVDEASDPTAYTAADAASLPDIEVLASVTVQGSGAESSDPSATVYLSAPLDEPVIVEDPGFLWVGYETVEEGTEGSCPVGCNADTQPGWQYMLEGNFFGSVESSWVEIDYIPDVRVVVGF